MPPKKATLWVVIWILAALIFAAGMFRFSGSKLAGEFITCYIIEWSLSVDNLFVFLLIFRSFGIEPQYQRRTLQWGIIGAVALRLLFILIGIGLVSLFEPVMYVFGAILVYSGVKMFVKQEEEIDIQENKYVKYIRKFLPVSRELNGDRFFIRRPGGTVATPLLLVLVVIDVFDVMFAVDSIPAAFAISRHPLVIFSANAFAIMGLRSLYFLLAYADQIFSKLQYGVAIVLVFVGVKMLIAHFIEIGTYLSLSIVLGTLFLSIIISTLFKGDTSAKPEQ